MNKKCYDTIINKWFETMRKIVNFVSYEKYF